MERKGSLGLKFQGLKKRRIILVPGTREQRDASWKCRERRVRAVHTASKDDRLDKGKVTKITITQKFAMDGEKEESGAGWLTTEMSTQSGVYKRNALLIPLSPPAAISLPLSFHRVPQNMAVFTVSKYIPLRRKCPVKVINSFHADKSAIRLQLRGPPTASFLLLENLSLALRTKLLITFPLVWPLLPCLLY